MDATWRKVCALLCNIFNKYDSETNMVELLHFGVVNRILSISLPKKVKPFHLAQTADESGF